MTSPTAISSTAAIRAGIALLAAFAFALSYDALRQMAVAIHIRGPLTYAFPLVIDGFIAIGVGALLMLRTAPTRSRVYVWALVGTATLTSIGANALHAVRLNQQTHPGGGLRLDDLTVGALSAIAPLALAGAVHLYIVVHRHPAPRPQEPNATERHNLADMARDAANVASGTTEAAKEPQPSAEPQDHKLNELSPERLALARTAPLGRKGRASRRHIEDTFRSQDLTIGRMEADKIKDALQTELDAAVSQRQRELDAVPVGAT